MKGVSYVELGNFLQKKREELGLSKAAVGKLVGVTAPAIGGFESGDKKPSRVRLFTLLVALQIKPSELDEVKTHSGYDFTSEELEAGLLAPKGEEEMASRMTVADLPLLQLMDRHGIPHIVAFLADPGNEALIRTILDTQSKRGKPLSTSVLQRITMMGRVNKVSFSQKMWETMIAELEEETA